MYVCVTADYRDKMRAVDDLSENTVLPATSDDSLIGVKNQSQMSTARTVSSSDDDDIKSSPSLERSTSCGNDDLLVFVAPRDNLPGQQTAVKYSATTTTSAITSDVAAAAADDDGGGGGGDADTNDTMSFSSSSSSFESCVLGTERPTTTYDLLESSQQTVEMPSSAAGKTAASAVTRTSSSSSSSCCTEQHQQQSSNDDGARRLRTSSKSKSSAIDDIRPLSPTCHATQTSSVTSSRQPEVDIDAEADIWRLNGKLLSSVVQRVMAAANTADGDCVVKTGDVISDDIERKSSSPLMVVNSFNITHLDFQHGGKQRSPQVDVVTPSIVVKSSASSDFISNGSSNGDKACADERDDRHSVDGLPTLSSEHENSDDISRRNELNRFHRDLWPSASPNNPGVILHDSGNTPVRENPLSKQKLTSMCKTESVVSTQVTDFHTNDHDSLSLGTARISDVINMADIILPTLSSSSQVNRTSTTPELEITENHVAGRRRSLEEQRSSDVTGHVSQLLQCFRSRADNENCTRTGVKDGQLVWKDVESEMMWRLDTTPGVWNAPTTTPETTTTTTTMTTTTRQKLASCSEEILLDNNHERQRQATKSAGDDGAESGAANVTWRYIRRPRGIADKVNISLSPVRRVALVKHYNLVVITTHDDLTFTRSRHDTGSEDLHDSLRNVSSTPVISESVQVGTNCPVMQESLLNRTAKTNSTSPFMPTCTLLSSTSTPSRYAKVKRESVTSDASNTELTTDIDHLISSLFSVTSTDDIQPDVENRSPPNSGQRDKATSDGNKPEVTNDDVTDDDTVTSLYAIDDGRRCNDEPQGLKHVTHGGDDVITTRCSSDDQSQQLGTSRSYCSAVTKSVIDEHGCDESGDVDVDDTTGSESRKNWASEQSANTGMVLSKDLTNRRGNSQASPDQQSTGSRVVRSDVTSRRGNVDVYEEKVFAESLATSIGKFSFTLPSSCVH